MRALILGAMIALGAVSAAPTVHAQGLNAGGLKRLPGVDPLETSPVQRLKRDARDWIDEERSRQAAAPTSLDDLAIAIERNIGPDIDKVSRRERIGSGDLFLVVMYGIVAPAHEAAEAELARLRAAGASDVEIQTAATARARLKANLAEVIGEQTVVSRTLIPELAWRE